MYLSSIIAPYLVFLISATYVLCHVKPDFSGVVAPELTEIRKRWGAADIIRDLEHIKQDVQKISKLQDSGEISTNEALFYFLRMHDFDDNNYLDGHELLAAMTHALEHADTPAMTLEEKEGMLTLFDLSDGTRKIAIVDTFFAYDDNNDGFVSYQELRKHLSSDDPNSIVPDTFHSGL